VASSFYALNITASFKDERFQN